MGQLRLCLPHLYRQRRAHQATCARAEERPRFLSNLKGGPGDRRDKEGEQLLVSMPSGLSVFRERGLGKLQLRRVRGVGVYGLRVCLPFSVGPSGPFYSYSDRSLARSRVLALSVASSDSPSLIGSERR